MSIRHDKKAIAARYEWVREQLRADPYRRVQGPDGLVEMMKKKFGKAISINAFPKLREEALRQLKSSKNAPSSTAMAYLDKQLATITKMLREALPDLTRFVMTASDGKTAVEYTMLQTSEISGKVKL